MYKTFFTASAEMINELSAAQVKQDARIVVTPEVFAQHVRIENGKAYMLISGAIVPDITYWGTTSLETLRALIDYAVSNDEVKEIVIGFNSPGGYAAGVEETANHIKRASAQKKITAFVFGMCASAAYWLASACSEIVVNASAELGSIGSVISVWIWDKEYKVEFVSKFAPNKRADAETKEGKEEYQKRVDAMGEFFLNTVAENRKMTPEDVIKAGDEGGLIMGSLAVARKLADRVGSLHELLAAGESTPEKNNDETTEIKEETEVSMDLKELRSKHPAVYAEACTDGIEKENKRVQAIMALSMPGNEALITEALNDPKMTAESVSMKMVQNQIAARQEAKSQLMKGSVNAIAGAQESPGDHEEKTENKVNSMFDQHLKAMGV